ncbi:Protein kinase domain-containing protein [Mycena sanguinolenta]|uniref:Protein kinase domain-containing protein n=1 Tax=Mycena sanguinolenta TaxID=230812 RepID=A0A8H6Z4G1_9AGAR|nr:Protein kinase domain-containing protein [Mycena sanguinolenta]
MQPVPNGHILLGEYAQRAVPVLRASIVSDTEKTRDAALLKFLKSLVDAMTQKDPALRPTIGEVIERFDNLCNGSSRWHLLRPSQKQPQTSARCRRRLKWLMDDVPAIPPYKRRLDRAPLSREMRAFSHKENK